LRAEWRHLTTVQPSARRWPLPFAAALASALPVLAGALAGELAWGLIASMGGLVFLYLPATPLAHRMVTLMACAFGLCACYALGVLAHLVPAALVGVMTFIAICVTMVCRAYALGPPGNLFFVMVAAIGAGTPGVAAQVPMKIGLLVLGCVSACGVALVYSLLTLRHQPPQPVPPLRAPSFDAVVLDAVVIGVSVGLALALGQALGLDNTYWVAVSTLAVTQGLSLRAVWTRQVHRVLGTALGLVVATLMFQLPLDAWGVCALIFGLTVVVETLVVRHYGLAAVFITPLTLLLAEAATLGQRPVGPLMQARLLDTVLGSLVGLLGGVCLHHPRVRAVLGAGLRALLPARLLAWSQLGSTEAA
jgi:uncharacterized membrane protein YccC